MDGTDTSTRDTASSIALQPISGTFGANVPGFDLAIPLPPPRIAALKEALQRHKVLVFRDQDEVGPGELLALARHFGEPEAAEHPRHRDLPGFPGVKELISDVTDSPEPKESWHTDGATRRSTRAVTLLQAVDVPPYGRDTAFADMEAIFESLSPPLQRMLEGLTAVHAYGPLAPHIPPVEHPVIRVNPATGRKALYISRIYTNPIVGLKPDESAALLDLLLAKTRLLEFQIRVSWTPGTIVIWDNEPTQHYLVFDRSYRRVMHRVMAL